MLGTENVSQNYIIKSLRIADNRINLYDMFPMTVTNQTHHMLFCHENIPHEAFSLLIHI